MQQETDTTKYGFNVGLNRIMGTGLRAQFVYLNDDVDEDTIGELIPELARDGSVYSLNINYSYYVGEKSRSTAFMWNIPQYLYCPY